MPELSFNMDLAPNVIFMIAGMAACLCCVQIILRMRKSRFDPLTYRELSDRLRTWWVILLLFAGALVLGTTASLVFFACVSYLALKEYFSIIPTRRVDRGLLLLAYAAVPIQYYWIAIGWYDLFIIFIPVYMLLLLSAHMVFSGHAEGFLKAIGTLHWGMMVTIYALSHAAYFLAFPPSVNPIAGGPGLILFLVFLTSFNDVAQYVWGKCFGRRKLSPQISPNKSWEGAIGGVATTMVVAMGLAPYLTPHAMLMAALAGALISISGIFGDLTVSAMKRDLGIKDTGSCLPGHGGILDRVDSLVFTAPLYFHFINYVYA